MIVAAQPARRTEAGCRMPAVALEVRSCTSMCTMGQTLFELLKMVMDPVARMFTHLTHISPAIMHTLAQQGVVKAGVPAQAS